MRHFDTIVAGLGAMGSATAAHLALRGQRVLGLERWAPGHGFGSSHGDSRIIREMYFEHPMYVPMVQRAFALWRELEERSGASLLHVAGGLMLGPADGALVAGTLRSAREHRLEHEVLSAGDVRARFPAFEPRETDVAVFDPHAGWLAPEKCNAAHLEVARAHGAELHYLEPVVRWAIDGDGVRVHTPRETYVADRLVVSAGARTGSLLPGLALPLTVERQLLFWLDPPAGDARYDSPACPIYIHEFDRGVFCYGFPRLARGAKAAVMHRGEVVSDADLVRRDVRDDEVEPLRRALAGVLPGLAQAPVRESGVCLFTNTPDEHFVVDFHPAHPQVLVSSACSGHGFKFASAIGELQADLLTDATPRFDPSPFRIGRFASPEANATAR